MLDFPDWNWITLWTAVAAIGTVGSLWLLIIQMILLRRDRLDDYLRRLIPFLSMDLYSDAASPSSIPVRVHADGGGIAYNVIINLVSPNLPMPATGKSRYLREGKPEDVSLQGNLPNPFGGELDIGFTDVLGSRHNGWQPVNCASGPLKTTGHLQWRCTKCRVHILPARRWFLLR